MPWDPKTLEFDKDGNLIIKDKDLAKKLTDEINKSTRPNQRRFQILDASGGGGTPANAMCPC